MTLLLKPHAESNIQDTTLYQSSVQAALVSRAIDNKLALLVKQNKGGTFYLSSAGHELVGAVFGELMKRYDGWGLPYYRDRAYVVARGASPTELLASSMAKHQLNHSGGRMMPEHFCQKGLKIPVQSSVVGSQILHAVGLALASKLSGSNEPVYVSAGDGATSQGDFHEAINFSCIHNLPIIFVIQDNGYAISVPVSEQTAGGDIALQYAGFPGLTLHDVDGTEYEQLEACALRAVDEAIKGTPQLVVARVPRLNPHSNSDNQSLYQTTKELSITAKKDPLEKLKKQLPNFSLIQEKIFEEIEEKTTEAEAYSEPDAATLMDPLFTPHTNFQMGINEEQRDEIVMVDAINNALKEAMDHDEQILVFGQDVARGKGGVFKATKDLTKLFGEMRCFNTPLAESTIIGISIGLALSGKFKPVAEVQFADYLWTGMNQLVNELSSMTFRSNGQYPMPVVLRMPCGGYIQGGPYHSQSIEAYLAHTPGLKVVYPSNAADAKRLMHAAIQDPNPILFLEHKALYRQRAFSARKEPSAYEEMEIGKANIIQEGNHLTILTYGLMTSMVVSSCHDFKESIEIIDLLTLSPLDEETILESVRKTGKCLIVQEANLFCGYGAELSALITEKAFEYLDGPIRRIGAKSCPVAYSKVFEEAQLPQKHQIIEAIEKLLAY